MSRTKTTDPSPISTDEMLQWLDERIAFKDDHHSKVCGAIRAFITAHAEDQADMTTAYMVGVEAGKDAARAKPQANPDAAFMHKARADGFITALKLAKVEGFTLDAVKLAIQNHDLRKQLSDLAKPQPGSEEVARESGKKYGFKALKLKRIR